MPSMPSTCPKETRFPTPSCRPSDGCRPRRVDKLIIGSGAWESVKLDDPTLDNAIYPGRDISNFGPFASRYEASLRRQAGRVGRARLRCRDAGHRSGPPRRPGPGLQPGRAGKPARLHRHQRHFPPALRRHGRARPGDLSHHGRQARPAVAGAGLACPRRTSRARSSPDRRRSHRAPENLPASP